ncbi:hypothetical protein DRQ36_03240 [bacterium]|nr:MAG: hypothetical protein DRQ36_03240 [bacterium]
MPEITFVGTGSGFVSVKRNSSCIFFSEANTAIILDCGDGATRALLKCGIDPLVIDGAVITHTHPDHSSGLPFLIQTLHLLKRETEFLFFVPPEITEFIPRLLIRHYMFPETLGFELIIRPIPTGETFRIGDIGLAALPNRHMQIHSKSIPNYPEISGEAFSLSVEAGGKRAVYSSDVFDLRDLEKVIAGGGELLICEATHIDLVELPRLLDKNPFAKVVLTHIPDELDISRAGKPDWLWATDGLKIEI